MRKTSKNIRLLIVFAFLLAGLVLLHNNFTQKTPHEEAQQMKQATEMAQDLFNVIRREKEARGIHSDVRSLVPNQFMIGNDYTINTTTLGSLNSKEISTNPDFAALLVRLISEAGLKGGDRVGLIISGSFPALAINTLAALQVMGMEVVMMSSLGASSYGANQPEATWLDMESWLIQDGALHHQSHLVSIGGENDRGEGLLEKGVNSIHLSAERNAREVYLPETLVESIQYRIQIFEQNTVSLLINIGGSQVAMGGCAHASTLPNGLLRKPRLCRHPDRGIIQEMSARGIPVINLLNIREMASNYGMDLAPGHKYGESKYLFSKYNTKKGAVAVSLCSGLLVILIFLRDLKK